MNKRKKKLPGKNSADALQLPSIRPGMPLEPLKSEKTDPYGSYTGNPIYGEVPVQDADDL